MTQLKSRIRSAKHRLWLNRWLGQTCWTLAGGGLLFAVVLLIQRLYDAPIPLTLVAGGLLGSALLASALWTMGTRESEAFAAARLDEAAGLRERISSGQYCLAATDDPFAQAVVADAERIGSAITVGKHIRLIVPKPAGLSLGALVLVAAMFLVPVGVLKKADGTPTGDSPKELETTKIAVKKQLESVRKLAETTPALAELKDELARMENQPTANLERPADVRHEAMKKIEALADAVRQKRKDDDYEAMPALERKLRGLRTPESSDAVTQKLTKSLREGDFKTAKEEVAAIKEQLATLKNEQDQEMTKKLGEQLDNLAKQLEQVAKDEKLAEKLENSGIKKEDIERALESLKKGDTEQVQKQLEEQGMNPQQAKTAAQQMQQQQNAGTQCQKMAQSMKQSAEGAAAGQNGEAMSGLSQAEAQLSELEQMQQEMAELDSTMQSLQAAKDSVEKPCEQCSGSGKQGDKECSKCKGSGSKSGQGPGGGENAGRGQGGRMGEEASDVAFKIERAKVHTGKGAIIGQFQMEGEQLPGEAKAQLVEVVAAAERDASDRIQRDRIPRQYQKAIKNYYSNVRRKLDADKESKKGASPTPTEPGAEAKPQPDKSPPDKSE